MVKSLPVLSLDTAKKAAASASEVDTFTLAEMMLTTVGVVGPTLLNNILADDIYRVVRPYMASDETAAQTSTISCNVLAIGLGVLLIYVGFAKHSNPLKYIGVPVVGANAIWILKTLLIGE